MNLIDTLPKPFFVLAPMYDVTDTVFRQIIADCAPPDLFFTEFFNVDGMQSKGRDEVLKRIRFSSKEKPIIAQVWGLNPDNFYKSAMELAKMGFDGIDINMGCPDKTTVKHGACCALINNRDLAKEMIVATKKGAGGLPISVKTRLGFNDIDLSWHEFLLKQDLDMLFIHGRTKSQMSKVPADWQTIGEIRRLRDTISPKTLIVGNGDVLTRAQGQELADKYKLDGIMIGRGVFSDPYVFSKNSPWPSLPIQDRIDLFTRHVNLFKDTWGDTKPTQVLNKFCKIYINNFDGAKERREKLMSAKTSDELISLLTE